MRTEEEFVNKINEQKKLIDKYEEMHRQLVLYLKDFKIFPPDMTEEDKQYYYQFKGYKPDWSIFMQIWSHYLTDTWADYKDALSNA